jgi:hypothetical protein
VVYLAKVSEAKIPKNMALALERTLWPPTGGLLKDPTPL